VTKLNVINAFWIRERLQGTVRGHTEDANIAGSDATKVDGDSNFDFLGKYQVENKQVMNYKNCCSFNDPMVHAGNLS
jgi:hypothetical protein